MTRAQFVATALGIVAMLGLIVAAVNRSEDTTLAAGEEAATDPEPETTQAPETTEPAETVPEVPTDPDTPENLGPAGTLEGLDGWLQTDATSLEDFDGQVKILQFWTYSCHNCTATIPHLQEIYATHQPNGLEIIGVHAPEFAFEEDPANVAQAAIDLGVTWPIALDTNKTNFRDWQGARRFWPRTYVIDANGDVRFNHIGEGAYDELETTVAYLLENGGS